MKGKQKANLRADSGEIRRSDLKSFRLRNDNGMEVEFLNYGGIIKSILVPDKNGVLEDVVLGFSDSGDYLGDHPYFGTLVGRYCNRIAGGQFAIDGQSFQLPTNSAGNCLHGGVAGFSHKLWQVSLFDGKDEIGAELFYISPDGEEGFPGNLRLTACYILSKDNVLSIHYAAVTDAPTVINLTNHSYFNLAGRGDILDHELTINANAITPVNSNLIPTGDFQQVADGPFDFRSSIPIGLRINSDNEQMQLTGGYDHNFVLDCQTPDELELAAMLHDSASGRTLEVLTTEPGMQLYTTNFENPKLIGKGGQSYPKHAAVCLETQHFPNSPNQARFPSTVLRPGEIYKSRTDYSFGIR
ncbi:MAG: aldose epimerase family protein [Bacteroidota bacterium]